MNYLKKQIRLSTTVTKYFTTILLSVISLIGCIPNETVIIYQKELCLKQGGCFKYSGVLYNGLPKGRWTKFTLNGQIVLQVDFVKGKPKRIIKSLPFGDFISSVEVKNNIVHGDYRFKYFSQRGEYNIVGTFKNGLRIGEWKYRWFDETIWKKVFYNDDGTVKESFLFNNHSLDSLHKIEKGIRLKESYYQKMVHELIMNGASQKFKNKQSCFKKDSINYSKNYSFARFKKEFNIE